MPNEMTDAANSGGKNELSTDIATITAEINAYQRVAGEAIFEIGRRLKHVKENDLVHGEFMEWYESIGLTKDFVSKAIRVTDNLTYFETSRNIGLEALYQIATLPETERTAEHTTSKGETKTPDEMTVREIRELKKELAKTEAQREEETRRAGIERKERERLGVENEELSDRLAEHIPEAPKEPEVRTEYVERESEPYDRMMDEPYSVERGNEFYRMMNDVDDLYKKYAHLKDATDELNSVAKYDEDLEVKYRKADEFWRMLEGIFKKDKYDLVDAVIIEN